MFTLCEYAVVLINLWCNYCERNPHRNCFIVALSFPMADSTSHCSLVPPNKINLIFLASAFSNPSSLPSHSKANQSFVTILWQKKKSTWTNFNPEISRLRQRNAHKMHYFLFCLTEMSSKWQPTGFFPVPFPPTKFINQTS